MRRMADPDRRRRATEHVRALLSAWVDYEDSGDRALATEMIGLLSALAAVSIRMQSKERMESPQKVLQDFSLDIERRLGES